MHLCLNVGMFASPALATQLLPGERGVPNWVPFSGVPSVMTYFSIVSLVMVMSLPLFICIPVHQWWKKGNSTQV